MRLIVLGRNVAATEAQIDKLSKKPAIEEMSDWQSPLSLSLGLFKHLYG